MIISILTAVLLVGALCLLCVRVRILTRRRDGRTLAFLHPFCNDGGGGERVLWVAIRELIRSGVVRAERWRVVVYTGDPVSDDEIRRHALARFGVSIPAEVVFRRLALRSVIEPKYYPVATLIGQAVGSLLLAAEAVLRDPPDVLVDTTGLHFCLPLLRLLGVRRLACYVHYPIISSDMIDAVASRKAAHNNGRLFARFGSGTRVKLLYYRSLVALYRFAGRRSDVTMANGTWTARHIGALWGQMPKVVFPPCDTTQLRALPLEPPPPAAPRDAARLVLSVAQFRPEKDHAKQLRAFSLLLRMWDAAGASAPRPTLVVAGAVRHEADQRRLDELRAFASVELRLPEGAVRFEPNLSLRELHALLGTAAVGLHTMWNEHFGIGVVEMLAAGVATIAHRSGGPALDIIDDGVTGRLAETAEEYADAMASLLLKPGAPAARAAMAAAGRASVARFSEEAFAESFVDGVSAVL